MSVKEREERSTDSFCAIRSVTLPPGRSTVTVTGIVSVVGADGVVDATVKVYVEVLPGTHRMIAEAHAPSVAVMVISPDATAPASTVAASFHNASDPALATTSTRPVPPTMAPLLSLFVSSLLGLDDRRSLLRQFSHKRSPVGNT